MALILNIETTSKTCSVALAQNGRLLSIKEESEINSHASKLTPLIKELFGETKHKLKDLEAIAISGGPGSYTGLRIGLSTAKGICFALNIPLISISTLAALAFSAKDRQSEIIIPLLDARKNEVYAAVYNNQFVCLLKPQPIDLEIENNLTTFLVDYSPSIVGNGSKKVIPFIKNNYFHIKNDEITSQNLIELSDNKFYKKQFESLAYFEPYYLKNNYISK